MLIHNYFFIKDFVNHLKPILVNNKINSILGYKQDELYLNFDNKTTLQFSFFRGNCFYALFEESRTNNKEAKPRFRMLDGKTITDIKTIKFERVFYLEFNDNSKLVIMLYGRHSNILYFEHAPLHPKETFRFKIESDKNKELSQILEPSKIEIDKETSLSSFKFIPKEIAELYPDKIFYSTQEAKVFLEDLTIYWQLDNDNISATNQITEVDILKVLKRYYINSLNELRITELRDSLIKNKKLELNKKTKAIEAAKAQLLKLKNQRPLKETADLIMANLHLFKDNLNQVEVDDFYSGRKTTIKLPNNNISPLKYAEKLYKKSSGIKQEITLLENKIEILSLQLPDLQSDIDMIQSIESFKELKKFLKESKLEKQERELPFHEYVINKYIIRIGKNAKANDKMLQQYSNKNDLWLHAKDYSGSHVLIKKDNVNKTVPENIIETAASWAAWFSKGKNQSILPVIVTERKYVRKSKNLKPGQVLVDKETTIIVKPCKPF